MSHFTPPLSVVATATMGPAVADSSDQGGGTLSLLVLGLPWNLILVPVAAGISWLIGLDGFVLQAVAGVISMMLTSLTIAHYFGQSCATAP